MKRIVDERPESAEAAFLRAASGRQAPSRARKRALASVALAASALSTTSTAAATSVASFGWIKGIVGLGVVAIGISTGVAIHEHDARVAAPSALVAPAKTALRESPKSAPALPTTISTESAILAPADPATRAEIAAAPVNPTKPRETSRAALVAPAPSASAASATSPTATSATSPSAEVTAPTTLVEPSSAAKPSALADEVSRIESARNAVNGGRGAEALAALDAYATAHPRGKLRQEADALRVRALVIAGRRAEAAAKLRAFREAYPTSPHTAALESLLGS